MVTTALGNARHFTFSAQRYPRELEVVRFDGMESISGLFDFHLELVSGRSDLDFDKLVGQPASMVIEGRAAKRHLHGIIARIALHRVLDRRAIYHVRLVPPHWALTLTRDMRIFQQQTTQQIVTKVLEEAQITELEWKLTASYEPRDYCVQYRESDLDFICRLLEEEGLAFHFEHEEQRLKTVFSDSAAGFASIPGEAAAASVIYQENTSMVTDREFVNDFALHQNLRSGRVELRDFSFKKPSMELKGVAEGQEPPLEIYDFPGEFVDNALGRRLAAVRLEACEAGRQVGQGASDCSRFTAGHTFTLGADVRLHPRAELNQKYLLTWVSHCGSQLHVMGEEGSGEGTTYGNAFGVIPASVPFRPARVTPRPVARGVHSAVVVGPDGEEIYTDEWGRVKVHFQWDRGHTDAKRATPYTEDSSCWVRVSSDWAGGGFGGTFLPRVGQEVLVEFLDGDPDRPVVCGQVYNGYQQVPYLLPDYKTRAGIVTRTVPGGNGNTIELDDIAGKEMVTVRASKDYVLVVERDYTATILGNRSTTVGNDDTLEVERDREVTVRNDSTHKGVESVTYEAEEKLVLEVGGSSVVMTPTSIKVKAPNITHEAKNTNAFKAAKIELNPPPGFFESLWDKLKGLAVGIFNKLKQLFKRKTSEKEAQENLKKKLKKAGLDKAPTLAKQMADLEKKGWVFRESIDEKGSYCDRSKKLIIVNRNKSPAAAMKTMAHEMGHANYTLEPHVPPKGLTKQQYVDANVERNLNDEGAAKLNEFKVRDEIAKNGGDTSGFYSNANEKAVYKDYVDGKIDEKTANNKLGQEFGNYTTSTTGENYKVYYGKSYEKFFDKHGVAQGGIAPPPKGPGP